MSVGPPSVQWSTWWMSHHLGSRSHPSAWQCRSLAMMARRCAGVHTRVFLPTSNTSESAPKMMRVIEQSQATCFRVSTVMMSPLRVS